MKRNLILTTLLSLLLVIAYFAYEKPTHPQTSLGEAKALMNFSNLGELKSFKNNLVSIIVKDQQYFIGNPSNQHLADKKNVDLFLNYLGNLHHKTIIDSGERSDFIPNDNNQIIFQFENEKLVFTLGEKLQFSPEYYLELKRNNKSLIVLVEDKNIPDGVYQKEDSHNHDLNYRQILSLMNLDQQFFEDKKVFRKLPHLNVSRIELTNFRGHSYVVDFKNKTTKPPKPSYLKMDDHNIIRFMESLEKLRAKKIITNKSLPDLKQKLSEMVVISHDNRKITLSLFNKYKDRAGYFLVNDHDPFIFEMQRADCEFLFKKVDHYWNLRFTTNLEQTISINNKTFQSNDQRIQKITNLLKSRAMLMKEVDIKNEGYQYLYQLRNNDQTFKFFHKDEEILITIDGKSGLLYYGGKDFPLKIEK